jgi:hypothetical protein
MIKKEYKIIMKQMLMIAGSFLIIFSLGCGSHHKSSKTHINEHDFAQNPWLVATTDDVVIINLEHPDATDVLKNDSYIPGIDRIPLYFPEDVSHEFVVEHKKEGDAYFVLLLDEKGNEILRVDGANHTVTKNINAGTYTLEIHHGGGIDEAYTLFVRPGSTYTGGDCPGCDLRWTDLEGADLRDVDLSSANLLNSNLTGVDLTGAVLSYTNLIYANLDGADLLAVDLQYANLYRANLSNTDLRYADLRYADLRYADLRYTDLSNAKLSSAILYYADLSSATWTDGSICAEGSIGECIH